MQKGALMKLTEIDKNLLVHSEITEPDIMWLNIRQEPFQLHGILYDEERKCYTRLPQEIAEQVSAGVAFLNFDSTGGRVRFRTNSSFIGIHALMDNDLTFPHMSLTGQSSFDLYRKKAGEATDIFYHTYVPPVGMKTGYSAPWPTDGAMAEYCINFPSYDRVKELYIALKKDALLEAPAPYRHSLPVVYYGSSITQGGCASRPGNNYQSIISRDLNTDYINLGFSGSGKAEDVMVDYLAGLKMSVFVCDYDHNAPDTDYLTRTHLPLYRKIREKHPDLPIIFLSAPDILLRPADFAPRRDIVRKTYETALAEGD